MRRTITSLAIAAAASLAASAQANAATVYSLCSTGPERPLVAVNTSGGCDSGQT